MLRGLDETHVEYISTFDENASLEDVLTNAVTSMVSYFEGKEELLTLLQRYEHRLPAQETEAVQRRRGEVLEAIAGVLDRGVQAGTIRALDTALAGTVMPVLSVLSATDSFAYSSPPFVPTPFTILHAWELIPHDRSRL